jgi:hypothetical protein
VVDPILECQGRIKAHFELSTDSQNASVLVLHCLETLTPIELLEDSSLATTERPCAGKLIPRKNRGPWTFSLTKNTKSSKRLQGFIASRVLEKEKYGV